MSLSFCVLASGSAGNCTVVRAGERVVLVDAGISPRRVAAGLARLGISPRDVNEILLTHLDWDHLHTGWVSLSRSRALRFHVHRRHRAAALQAGLHGGSIELFDGSIELEGRISVRPVLLPHDETGSVGFVIGHGDTRLGYATDLGRVPARLHEAFCDLHALAIESNYDAAMQRQSARPEFLKRRIMGGEGHLSNEQCLEAVVQIAARSPLSHVALLHLSRQCNRAALVRSLYERQAPEVMERLTIASQHAATPMLHVHRRATVIRAAAPVAAEPTLFCKV
jgi:phosphoribosyl 1,2-cyclic phosphodiesterase